MFEDAEIIHRYTRAQAIADGVLHDVSDLATDAGFTRPSPSPPTPGPMPSRGTRTERTDSR